MAAPSPAAVIGRPPTAAAACAGPEDHCRFRPGGRRCSRPADGGRRLPHAPSHSRPLPAARPLLCHIVNSSRDERPGQDTTWHLIVIEFALRTFIVRAATRVEGHTLDI